MTSKLQADLSSALSKISNHFSADPELLHEAVAIVFSSILNKYGFSCIIVGGQSAAYWLRIPGSIDVDFVSTQRTELAELFLHCGFTTVNCFKYRFLYKPTNIFIEIVDEKLDIENVKNVSTLKIEPVDVENPIVSSLMAGAAEILNPVYVFLNYVEASDNESIWFDYNDNGALAIERAYALLNLYGQFISIELNRLNDIGDISERLVRTLHGKFNIIFK